MSSEQTNATDPTEPTEPTDPTDPTPPATPPSLNVETDDQPTGDVAALRREAAARRRALREVEAERDGLRSRLDDSDRREVERLAAERLVEPSDLWLATSIEAMRAEDGTIDMDRARAELARVEQEKPHWRKPSMNLHQGAREPAPPAGPSFGDAVKKAIGR